MLRCTQLGAGIACLVSVGEDAQKKFNWLGYRHQEMNQFLVGLDPNGGVRGKSVRHNTAKCCYALR